MTSVLVTGGAGYIGSHVCKLLAGYGYKPVVLDDLSRGNAWAVRWGPLVEGSIGDAELVDRVFAEHAPIAVIHFAALAYVGESVEHPMLYYRRNVAESVTLLERTLEAGCDKVVFSSTCATYGLPQSVPISEDHPQQPINPYGFTKLAVERMLLDAGVAHGLQSVLLRYFNAAGADPDGELGEQHVPETHLIPLVLEAAAGMRPQIDIFGDDYSTDDGSAVRDYIHVWDLAEAHVLALRRLLKGDGSGIFNLGTGHGASVFEVIEAARRVTGCEIPMQVKARRPGDPPVLVSDPTRVRSQLRWTPRYPDLDHQIAHAWHWMHRGCSKPS